MAVRHIEIPSECYNILQRESHIISELKNTINRKRKLGIDYYEDAVVYKAHQYLMEYYKELINAGLSDVQNLCYWDIDVEQPNTIRFYVREEANQK